MTIQTGDRLPDAKLTQATPEGPRELAGTELFAGRTVVLFGVPGAFTPTCSARHLPGFVQHAAELKARGVDAIACMAVNDAFVLQAWAREQGISDEVTLLADGSATLTRALGLEMDLTARGMGVRCKRFALVAKDGVVTYLGIEEPGAFEVSKAEAVLAAL